jgi:hypothetical protein
MNINRRKVILSMGSGLAVLLLSSGKALSAATLFSGPYPDVSDVDNPSFEVFYRLSQWVTCEEKLDLDIAKKLYKIFQKEPWGKQHISRSYLALKAALSTTKDKTLIPTLIRDKALGEGESWFVSHLLITWYLGAYYHESTGPIRVTHDGALMWGAVNDITAVPGVAHGFDEFWANAPLK